MTHARNTYLVLGLLLLASYVWLAWQYSGRAHGTQHGVCITKTVSGVPCPACGTSRSVVLLTEGHVGSALILNPLGLLALLSLLVAPLWLVNDVIRKRPTLATALHRANALLNRNRALFWLLMLLLAANWVWNIIKGL